MTETVEPPIEDEIIVVGLRNRVVHGWAFMALPDDDVAAIQRFLETGRVGDLPERWHPVASLYVGRTR